MQRTLPIDARSYSVHLGRVITSPRCTVGRVNPASSAFYQSKGRVDGSLDEPMLLSVALPPVESSVPCAPLSEVWSTLAKKPNRATTTEATKPAPSKVKRKAVIVGTTKATGIKAVPKVMRRASIFAIRVAPDQYPAALKRFFDKTFHTSVTCTKIETPYPTTYSSLHITAHVDNPRSFHNNTRWPADICVRWDRSPKVVP